MYLTDYNQRLVDLAQKWMTGMISEAEYLELDNWYRSWEDASLACPVEMTVDKLEKRLHEQLYKNVKPKEQDNDFDASRLYYWYRVNFLSNYLLFSNSFFSFSAIKRRS